MTAVSMLRGNLTVITSVSLRKYYYFLKLTLPNILSTILSSSKLLLENPRILADSRTSKNIQGFVNTLDILGSF